MGYAKPDKRTIAVSSLAFDPLKTTAHEISHIFLHSDQQPQRTCAASSWVDIKAVLQTGLDCGILSVEM